MSDPDVRTEYSSKKEHHCADICHQIRVDDHHNVDAHHFLSHFLYLLHEGYAPSILPLKSRVPGKGYRCVVLRYCVGRCEEGQGPSVYLDTWDELGDHKGLQRRFTVSLMTDIIGDSSGNIRTVQPSWEKPYNQVKRWARMMLWQQVEEWEEFHHGSRRPGGPRSLRNMPAELKWCSGLERDGDFGVKNGVRDWSAGLEGIPRDARGRPRMIRPSRPRSATSKHRIRGGPSPNSVHA